MSRAIVNVAAAALCAVFVGLWPDARAHAQERRIVVKMSYEVGTRILDDEFVIRLSERTIQFTCDSFQEGKGPTVPRAGGSDSYSEDTDKNRRRTCQITVRRDSAQALFFQTLKTVNMKEERDKKTGQLVTHRDSISFLLTLTGTACQVSSIKYAYNEEKPYRITASSCQ